MTSNINNSNFEKTSFLHANNSSFIKDLYLQYLKDPLAMPESWKEFFDGLGEDQEIIRKEILGPSWSPKKNENFFKITPDNKRQEDKKDTVNNKLSQDNNLEIEKQQSVKAIAMIRAYRIRGHLIANLDPLGMMERKYLHELHPLDHGFKKEDYNKNIYLYEYMDRGYATINELLTFLKSTYCSTIGVESVSYTHLTLPTKRIV